MLPNFIKNPAVLTKEGAIRFPLPANEKSFTLEELQAIVGGNVQLIVLPNGLQMWINEEGKIDNLQLNISATMLWQVIYYGYEIGADDFVVGDCLICESKWTE